MGKLICPAAENQVDDCGDLGRSVVGTKREIKLGLIDVLDVGGGSRSLLVEGIASSIRKSCGQLFLHSLSTILGVV